MGIQDAAAFYRGLVNGTSHPLPCVCDLCLYSTYRTRPKKEKGRPYGRLAFFVNWIIHRAKMEHLIVRRKAQKIPSPEGTRWTVKIRDYEKAPFGKRVSEIITALADDAFKDIADDLERIALFVNKNRTEQIRFQTLINDLTKERRRAWILENPGLEEEWKRNREVALLCQRIVDFIKRQPGKKATMGDLYYHFSNKRKADLERALEWSPFYPALRRGKKGKSLIFCWTPRTNEEVAAYNKRIEEIALNRFREQSTDPGTLLFVPENWIKKTGE